MRKESFLYTVHNKLLEDLQIGFQCKIKSNPEDNFLIFVTLQIFTLEINTLGIQKIVLAVIN